MVQLPRLDEVIFLLLRPYFPDLEDWRQQIEVLIEEMRAESPPVKVPLRCIYIEGNRDELWEQLKLVE